MNNQKNNDRSPVMIYVLHFARFVSVFALIIGAALLAIKITSANSMGNASSASAVSGAEKAAGN
jgi:hypothetical protein